MEEEYVILVNEKDEEVGKMEKLQAHQEGKLHRAFSIFIVNSKKEILIQQRAATKYHSAGLWSNTCCGHPRPSEITKEAALRRLNEEMGMIVELKYLFQFTYLSKLENNLTEHELDHVFIGFSDETPVGNPKEISDWKYVKIEILENELKTNSEKYTTWLKIVFGQLKKEIQFI